MPMIRLDDTLYPISPAVREGYLDRTGHQVHYTESGNPAGIPMVLIHGGPGGQSSEAFRRLASADFYRIIQFDQRGCGKSESKSPTVDNTLQHTVEDMEALREATGVEQWVVAGGSWGSTVALAYAEAHPGRCLGLLLVSTWLLRKADIDWWF